MKPFRLSILLLGFSALVFSSAHGDVINIKDGTSAEGILKRADDGWIVLNNGKITHVPGDQVESIELGPATAPTAAAAVDRLASLRKSVENLSDLSEIIARYQRFIDQDTDAASNGLAKNDLNLWHDRQKQKLVKVATQWVTAADRQRLVDQAGASAETARQLMKQGRTKEAESLLLDCVSVDPQNATAWYLIGLLRYQQEQLPAARKAFETVAPLVPNHAPTLNNLAVNQWRQHQFIPALMNFNAAMLAAMVNKTILDNVAIAFQTLKVELRQSPVTLEALRQFNEQDQQLAALLARDGLHRFGLLWVTDQDHARLEQQEKDFHDKLDQLANDFQRDKDRADQLDSDITENQAAIHRIEADSYITDPRTGAAIPVAYPSSYYDLVRDTEKLTRDRDAIVAKMDAIKTKAQNLQHALPSVKNPGVMLMIGVGGTPIRIPAAVAVPVSPATQPAESPAAPVAR